MLTAVKRFVSTGGSVGNNLIAELSKIMQKSNSGLNTVNTDGSIRLKDRVIEYVAVVNATKNNTIITLSNASGKCLTSCTAGMVGLKKANRGSSDAGQQVGMKIAEIAKQKHQLESPNVHVKLKGFGPGRDAAFRAFRASGWEIKRITDITPIKFGGCRPRKKRRL